MASFYNAMIQYLPDQFPYAIHHLSMIVYNHILYELVNEY